MSESISIKEDGNFKRAREYYDNNDCHITLSREIKKSKFFKDFIDYFRDIDNLSMSAYGDGVSYDFLYQIPNLENLYLHTMYSVDFQELKQLKSLSLWWNKKMITNFNKLRNLEHLSITEFDEKDLTKLSSLSNLKSLSFKTTKIKSLKGIETLTNLKCLSFGGVRSLTDVSDITSLQNLKFLEFDICWKMQDFHPVGELKNLEVLQLMDCKNLASIKFIEQMPKLIQLHCQGSTIINDFDTTPAENVPVFFGSRASSKYNKEYPEKEIQEGQKTWNSYL